MDETQSASVRPLTFGSRRRRYLALALNVCFFAFVAWWLRGNVNFDDLARHLRQIPPRAILLAMAMNSVVLLLFGMRLATILGARTLPCFLITVVGMTFNSLLPFRLGEGVKIYCGNALFKLPIGGLGAAVVMEKLYDLSVLLLLLSTVALTANSGLVAAARPLALTLAVALPLCGLLILRARATGFVTPPSGWTILKKYRLDRIAREAESLFAHQKIARPALLSLLIWTTNVLLVLFFFSAVAPEMRFGVLDAMTLMVIAALAIALPFSPAGLGVFEAGIATYLTTVHGLPTEKAISAALACHFAIATPHSVIAALFLLSLLIRSLKARF
jgi:uncharacterized membrane protein YbhN (UPF0104 family)